MPDAIINALGTIAAAFVGVVTWYLASRHDRQRELSEREAHRHAEERLRDQRVLDIVVALHSEILAGIVANRRQLTKEDAEYAMAQETPFATADDTDFVFDSVKDDLSILPAEVIHSVVQYYRTAKQSNLLTADLRDPYFLRQTPSEKRRIGGMSSLSVGELPQLEIGRHSSYRTFCVSDSHCRSVDKSRNSPSLRFLMPANFPMETALDTVIWSAERPASRRLQSDQHFLYIASLFFLQNLLRQSCL